MLPGRARFSFLVVLLLTGPPATAAPVPNLIPTSTAIWSVSGTFPYETMGTSVSSAGDVNGDGFDDVIVGAPGWGPGNSSRGRATLFLGSQRGLSTIPAWSIDGTQEGSLGYSVAGAGDVDGDGYDDVIVGEYGYSGDKVHSGRALLFLGSRSGRATRSWAILGSSDGELFGEDVAAAGDVNGDGFDDVLVGGEVSTKLIFGRPGRIDDRNAWVGPKSYHARGVGDLNGDGFDDIALVGGPETLVFFGSASGPSSTPSWRGPSALSVSAGDINGDGFSDLLLGPELNSSGTIRLFLGSVQGPGSSPAWQFHETGFGFGLALAANGDVNGDGFDDVLVLSPRHTEGTTIQPAVLLFLGGNSGPSNGPDWTGSLEHSSLADCALGADVDGDGASEVLAGDYESLGGLGRALLFHLGPGYPVPAIVHEPVITGTLGAPVTLQAIAIDHTHRVVRVEILVRSIEEFDYGPPIPMDPIGGDTYRGVIPATKTSTTDLVYQIRAVDDYGLEGKTDMVGLELNPASASSAAPQPFLATVIGDASETPGRISFQTSHDGPARVQVFDVRGRRVATVLDQDNLPRGKHAVPLPAASAGVYFYRVETADGVSSGRFVALRARR